MQLATYVATVTNVLIAVIADITLYMISTDIITDLFVSLHCSR